MNYHRLGEGTRNNLIDYLKANISAALDVVGAAVGSPQMSIENPKSYFIFERPHGYSLPALFVIVDSINFRLSDKKPNCINAKVRVNVSVEVEDQDAEILTYKADRYMSALHQVLDSANILSTDGKLSLKVVVGTAQFSPKYMAPEGSGDGGKFRKEILLQCDVEHVENL